nr:hypothetical protein [Parasutterella muris]
MEASYVAACETEKSPHATAIANLDREDLRPDFPRDLETSLTGVHVEVTGLNTTL